MNSGGVSRSESTEDASESQSRPKETTTRIELVRARHEIRIRKILVDWFAEAPACSGHGIPILTRNQQSILQECVVDMFVDLGEAQLVKLLAECPAPLQFESDSDHLIEFVATDALARWRSLTMRYDLTVEPAESVIDPTVGVEQNVLHRLIRVAERYKLKAWSDLEKRLEAECSSMALAPSDPTIASSEPSVRANPRSTVFGRSLAKKIEHLRRNKGLSVDQLAELAKVDKKTLLGISKGSRPHPSTMKQIADALGTTVKDLEADVRNPAAP